MLYEFSCWTRIFFSHIGIVIRRWWTTDRKLHVDTLVLIPTWKFYVFSYNGQIDEQTDGQRNTPAAHGLEECFSTVFERFLEPIHALCSARIRLVIHVNHISKFLWTFSLNPNFLLAHRNRYSEGMDDGQKTPRGHPDISCLEMYCTNVLMYRTMVLLAHLTKVRC